MHQKKTGKSAVIIGFIMVGLLMTTVAMAAPNITGQALDKIIIGSTSKAEVISMLGPPQKTEAIGSEEVMYYQTLKRDPITKSNLCNVATITIAKDEKVKNIVFQRYCQQP